MDFVDNLATTTVTVDYGNEGYTGTIPTQFGRLTDATIFNLGTNDMTGTVPTELGNMVKVSSFDLSMNTLTAALPTELGQVSDEYGVLRT